MGSGWGGLEREGEERSAGDRPAKRRVGLWCLIVRRLTSFEVFMVLVWWTD